MAKQLKSLPFQLFQLFHLIEIGGIGGGGVGAGGVRLGLGGWVLGGMRRCGNSDPHV